MICQADARHIPLADGSVQCVVTSPPYWGLRDYDLATWEGGDAECDHDVGGQVQDNKAPGAIESGVRPGAGSVCLKCGAIRHDAGIGLEKTPEGYVANIVAVFREVWRVLRPDGTLWLNLGDCYSASPGQRKVADAAGPKENTNVGAIGAPSRSAPNLKPKDLVGIPWRVAFALQADGWYLRSDIIWAKPNPMPESVTDRPTKSHEYLFLLSKQPRYYYNAEAIKEPSINAGKVVTNNSGKNSEMGKFGQTRGGFLKDGGVVVAAGRNRRDVWFIATQPYKGAHFATFPPALVEPCILAGTKRGDIALDPFCGSGTVGQVCRLHGRRFVGLDLSMNYLRNLALPRAMAMQAVGANDDLPLFANGMEPRD